LLPIYSKKDGAQNRGNGQEKVNQKADFGYRYFMGRNVGSILMLFCALTSAHGAPSNTELLLHKSNWEVTWDFRERALTPTDGLSSIAAYAIQPEDNHFVFFGWLGAVKAGKSFGAPYVGFAIVSQDTSKTLKGTSATRLEIEARTDSPDVLFDLLVEDQAIQKENKSKARNSSFLAKFQSSDSWKTYSFEPSDFVAINRGVEVAGHDRLDLSKIQRLGFQVRKSAQEKQIAVDSVRTPFRLQVRAVRLR
jgi:hypothetical protein